MDKKIKKCGCGGEAKCMTCAGMVYVKCESCELETKAFDGFSLSKAIESWNTSHPEISNAMQAVKWLEEGKGIYNESFNNLRYFKMINGTICSFNIDDNKMLSDDVKFLLFELFERNWQLYEEPKYKKLTTEEVLTDFALNGENKKIVLVSRGQEFYITRIENTIKFSSLSNPLGGMDKSREQLKGLQWRIYEN